MASHFEAGASFGPYRIERLIGSGGMGEVYRAHDSRLRRDVAIKVLPRDVTADPERVARMTREARVLASLSHPHIGAVFGLEEAGGVQGIVLELIEGPTLAETLAAGRMATRDALTLARQIAEALEAAHERGVVHRDLKPANVKITPAGAVKVLDFGLAKADVAHAAMSSIPEAAATVGATRDGVLVGTTAYMSPEQARGRGVDRRTDVWAFGCVLYEMLTGNAAFRGESFSDTLAAVLDREPDWAALPSDVPPSIAQLLKRCLRKDAAARLHDIADARIEIDDALAATPVAGGIQTGRAARWLWPAVAAVATSAAVALAVLPRADNHAATDRVPVEFAVNLPEGIVPALGVAVSPDGRRIAMGAVDVGLQLWLHSLDSSDARPIPGAAGGVWPFWSPDGSTIGFFANGKLKKVDAAGGPVVVLGDAGDARGGSWRADGTIIFSGDSRLHIVPASGGPPVDVEFPPRTAASGNFFPQWLPDGDHVLYHEETRSGGTIRVGSLSGRTSTRVIDSEYGGVYTPPGYLLFVRGGSLMAQEFDAPSLTLRGRPSVVSANAAPGFLLGRASFNASRSGALVLATTRLGSVGELTWFDREGRPQNAMSPSSGGEYLNPAISPSGEQVAVNRMDPETGKWDVWVVDASRQIPTRATLDGSQNTDPLWTPDGRQIVFGSNRGGRYGLYRKAVDGSGADERLLDLGDADQIAIPTSISPDGQFLLFTVFINAPFGRSEVWILPLTGERQPRPLLKAPYWQYAAKFSPDGRWVAFASMETGVFEIYLQEFPTGRGKVRVSQGGGTHPRWMAHGRQLVFAAVPSGLATVDLSFDASGVRIGAPRTLPIDRYSTLMDGRSHYDVGGDGQRFLVRRPARQQLPQVTVILNWLDRIGRP